MSDYGVCTQVEDEWMKDSQSDGVLTWKCSVIVKGMPQSETTRVEDA